MKEKDNREKSSDIHRISSYDVYGFSDIETPGSYYSEANKQADAGSRNMYTVMRSPRPRNINEVLMFPKDKHHPEVGDYTHHLLTSVYC